MLPNSHPPWPPLGQEGRGSYVWIPHHEELNNEDLVDVAADEDNDGSAKTEEEFVAPYAADEAEFPEGSDIDEPGIGANEDDMQNEGHIA
jgi:hypothetical protein